MTDYNEQLRPFSDDERAAGGSGTAGAHPSFESIVPVPASAPDLDLHLKVDGVSRLPDATWRYEDEAGDLIGYACRWNLADGSKEFRFASWCRSRSGEESWRLQHLPAPRPLYGLPAIAAGAGKSIVIVEGEKTVEAARKVFRKSLVTTSIGGANGGAKADWSVLAKASKVLIVPDNDDSGRTYASDVARCLAELGLTDIRVADAEKIAGTAPDGSARAAPEGWDLADAIDEGWDVGALYSLIIKHSSQFEPGPSYVSFHPFEMSSDGLTVEVATGRGDKKTVQTIPISAAFEVLGRARDPNGEGWSRYIRWQDDDRRPHIETVADADLHGDVKALCGKLAHKGLRIDRAGGKYLADYLNAVDVSSRVTLVTRTGWTDLAGQKCFVLPDGGIGAPPGERVILAGSNASPYVARGALDDWKSSVATLVASHSRPVLSVSVAFAGPLLSLVGYEGGGINLFGQSSRGKSTCLYAAASVWGKGTQSGGFVRSWRSTANGMEGAAAIHTDTILALDELGVVDAREAGAAIYQLAAGTGKGRMTRDSALRPSQTWCAMTLSTGEIPMSTKIAEDKGRKAQAGQQVRMLDIAADSGRGYGAFDNPGPNGDPAKLADAIKQAAQMHYGTAGPAFIRAIMAEGPDAVGKAVLGLIEAFKVRHLPATADGQVTRAAARLGLIAAAGELATEWGIVPWQSGEATAAAARALTDWIEARGGVEGAEVRDAIAQVRRFIEAHGDARFEPLEPKPERPYLNRAGWRSGSGANSEWLIPSETWKSEICVGINATDAARFLAERGMLKLQAAGYQCVMRTHGYSRRVYVLTAAIFDGAEA